MVPTNRCVLYAPDFDSIFPHYVEMILRRFARGQILLPWSGCEEPIIIFVFS